MENSFLLHVPRTPGCVIGSRIYCCPLRTGMFCSNFLQEDAICPHNVSVALELTVIAGVCLSTLVQETEHRACLTCVMLKHMQEHCPVLFTLLLQPIEQHRVAKSQHLTGNLGCQLPFSNDCHLRRLQLRYQKHIVASGQEICCLVLKLFLEVTKFSSECESSASFSSSSLLIVRFSQYPP